MLQTAQHIVTQGRGNAHQGLAVARSQPRQRLGFRRARGAQVGAAVLQRRATRGLVSAWVVRAARQQWLAHLVLVEAVAIVA